MRHHFVWLAAAVLLPLACTKEPGIGGKAEIRGRVYVVDYNDNTGQPTGEEYWAAEQRVYIIYGDHDYYDDDLRTGPDGLFKFSWLRKGKYTIYTMSECQSCPGGQYAVSKAVEIGDRKGSVDAGTFVIENW